LSWWEEADLAWALAEAATRHLSAVERDRVYVAIGVGETFAAIRYLIEVIACKRIGISADLVRQCTSLLDAYAGHEEEPYLRGAIAHVLSLRRSASLTARED
jgi:hypothetical protein